ncbi:ribosome-binding protein, partial [Coemansia sp. RSA 1285]
QLISSDTHSGTSNYKFTYSVEIIPICKDDLVVMPKKMANALGQIAPLALCTRVGNSVHIIDVKTLQTAEVSGLTYWRQENIRSIGGRRDLKQFYVMDVDPIGPRSGRFVLADITIQRMADVGRNDDVIIVRSHLGGILKIGDAVLGYDLLTANINEDSYDKLNPDDIPSVILVKKTYPEGRRKRKPRNWRLKSLNKDDGELAPKKQDQERLEVDFEAFLRDLEEDPELRSGVNLYKDTGAVANPAGAMEGDMDSDNDDDEENELPEVPLEELLDDLKLDDASEDEDDVRMDM